VLHSLDVGGAEVLAARLARRLGGEHRFVFACLDGLGALGEELRAEGVPVHVLGRAPGVDWRCAARLGALLRRERVDVLHSHQYTPFFYSLMGRWLCRRPPVLFTEHGRHHPDYPRRKRMVVNRLLLERRDRVIGVGEAVRQALIHNEGIPAGRVGVVFNGIDLGPFAASHDRAAARHELGAGAGELLILQVARLDPLKDHLTALATFQRVLASRPDALLVLAGEGPERPRIEGGVRQLGLADRVRLLGTRADVARLMAAADVFLLTSISEGIPLTLIEAMAAGLPVVSTDVGGVREVIPDGGTGLLAPAGDAEALARHVLHLAERPETVRELGKRGRLRARAVFDEEAMHAAYHRLYEEMASA
jgi:glycosyltransferase involved in cell wall biosynthesis